MISKTTDSLIASVGVERVVVLSVVALFLLFLRQEALISTFSPMPSEAKPRWLTLTLTLLDSVFLYIFYHSLLITRFTPIVRATLVIVAATMYIGAILTPTTGSSDMYAYIAYGKLGWDAYAPPENPFGGSFSPLNAVISRAYGHLEPAPYGPLFIGIAHLIAGPAASIEQARFELRLLNVAALVACAGALRRLGLRMPVLGVMLLDPQIVINFVVDGHNDILAIAAIVVGMAMYSKSKTAAIAIACMAGAMKAPYVVPALLVVYNDIPLLRRLSAATTIFLGTLLLSSIGGMRFIHALTCATCSWKASYISHSLPRLLLRTLGASGAVIAVLIAVAFRRKLPLAALLFPQIFAAGFPWYVVSGLPYAALSKRGIAAFAIIMPIWMYMFRITS